MIASAEDTAIDGWRRLWSVDYARHVNDGSAVTETRECCVTVFGKGAAYLVLKTQPVTRNPADTPITERVLRRLWITQRPGEQTADCTIFWLETQFSRVDSKTDAIRSVVVDGGDLALFEWRGAGNHCAFGD